MINVKIELDHKPKKEIKYPILARYKSNDTIMILQSPDSGTVISIGSSRGTFKSGEFHSGISCPFNEENWEILEDCEIVIRRKIDY